MTRKLGLSWPILNTPLKVAQIDMCIKTDAQPVGNLLENYKRPELWLIWDPKWPKNGPLRPIFSTHLKVPGISMWSNTVVKLVNLFKKVTKHQKFLLLWDPKRPRNWAFGAHILHISESSNKIFENLNFDSFAGPKWPKIWASGASLLHTYKSSSNELVNQVSSEHSRNVSGK